MVLIYMQELGRGLQMTKEEEKSGAVEANQMMLLLMIEEISTKTTYEMEALIQTGIYYKNMKKNHVLVDSDKVLEKYYDSVLSFENKPTLKQKVWYTIRRLLPRRSKV